MVLKRIDYVSAYSLELIAKYQSEIDAGDKVEKTIIEKPVIKAILYITRIGWITKARIISLKEFHRLLDMLHNMPWQLTPTDLHRILGACKRIRAAIYTKNSKMHKADRIYIQQRLKEIETPVMDNLQLSLRIEGIQNGVR